jgi:hypothetical protein
MWVLHFLKKKMSRDINIKPNWLQKLWNENPSLAKEAEKDLNELGADIRNKLTPPNNLIAILKQCNITHKNNGVNTTFDKLIKKEITNTQNSIEYLKNLL